MGSGINAARESAPVHAAVLDDMKDQLLLVLLQRLGGDVSIPVSEVDATGSLLCSMQLVGHGTPDVALRFVVSRKH